MTTPPPPPRAGAPVFPGIAQFKAEPPIPGHARVWHLNGCVEDGNPDDMESYGWLAEITPYWGNESGDLARFLARAGNCHNALVAALSEMYCSNCGDTIGQPADAPHPLACPKCRAAREALALARGEPS